MTNIVLNFKNMNHQLSNALSTMFLRRLDIFLRFETYMFQNPQKAVSTDFHIYQLDFLPHIYMSQHDLMKLELLAKDQIRLLRKQEHENPKIY